LASLACRLAQAGSWREAAKAARLSLATQADPEIAALLGDCLLNMDGTGYIAAEPIYRAANSRWCAKSDRELSLLRTHRCT
jgi:hypothetical protein